jgi:hypothetical protein
MVQKQAWSIKNYRYVRDVSTVKEQQGMGITLVEALPMSNGLTRYPIEENSR